MVYTPQNLFLVQLAYLPCRWCYYFLKKLVLPVAPMSCTTRSGHHFLKTLFLVKGELVVYFMSVVKCQKILRVSFILCTYENISHLFHYSATSHKVITSRFVRRNNIRVTIPNYINFIAVSMNTFVYFYS